MNFRYFFFFSFFFFQLRFVSAQKEKLNLIEFHPVFGKSSLSLNDVYYRMNSEDSLQVESLKFYISNIELLTNNIPVWKERNSYHLIDVSDKKSLIIFLENGHHGSFNKIKFNIGIDSITNVSGAMPGALDPTLGMYWTWQSGYINFKLEGNSNVCQTRNHEFQFHLGGYLPPFNTLQTVLFTVSNNKIPAIAIDIQKFISANELVNDNHVMTPGKQALLLSQKLPGIFRLEQE